MAANGISTLSTKQERQLAKLNLAQLKRRAVSTTYNTRIYQGNSPAKASMTVLKTYGDLNGIVPLVGWTITGYGPITAVKDNGTYWTLSYSGTAFSGGQNVGVSIVAPATTGGARYWNTFSTAELPSVYTGNVNTPQTHASGLQPHRPWTSHS